MAKAIFGIFLLVVLYFLLGGLIVAIYGLTTEAPIPFDDECPREEKEKMALILTFWPIYITVIVIKFLIEYIKVLCSAIKNLLKKYIKFERKNDEIRKEQGSR